MEIDVGGHISEVLYDNDQVSIPGLGEFEANYQSAAADVVHGRMLPPAKQLVFKRVPGNDNFLVKYIKDQHNISFADAQQVVENYVGQVKTSIDNKEIFVFPNIGRLYKDYEQELRFLPDKENFNKSSFGLPEVELFPALKPVLEEEAPAIQVPPITAEEVVLPVEEEPQPGWIYRNLIPIVAIGLVILAYGTFAIVNNFYLSSPQKENDIIINKKPSSEDVNVDRSRNRATIAAPDVKLSPATEEEKDRLSIQDIEEAARKATPPRSLPKPYSATISVGVFTNANNADLMASTLIREGYKPLTDKVGQSSRVMIVVDYVDELELDQILAKIKKRIEPTAEVLKSGLKQETNPEN